MEILLIILIIYTFLYLSSIIVFIYLNRKAKKELKELQKSIDKIVKINSKYTKWNGMLIETVTFSHSNLFQIASNIDQLSKKEIMMICRGALNRMSLMLKLDEKN